jgi:hypothetical protein
MEKTKIKLDLMLKNKYQNTTKLPETTAFMHLPSNWFIKGIDLNASEICWHCDISLNSNAKMDKYAFINKKKRLYIAFT